VRAVIALPLLLAAAAGAQPANPYLNQAKEFQAQLDFEKCLRRLEQASRWNGNTKQQLAQIELYSGLCEAGLGHEKEAAEHFELGFALDPSLELPPQQGPKITALFKKAKAHAPPPDPHAEIKPAPPLEQPTQAVPPPEPPPTPAPAESQPTPAPATIEAAKTTHLAAPLSIAAVSVVSCGVGIAFGVLSKSTADTARMAMMSMFESDVVAKLQIAQTYGLIANVLFGVAGAALIAAVATYFGLN
jgi:hypothetical protein